MHARHPVYSSLLLVLCGLLAVSTTWADAIKLRGSGASFPFPLYGLWFKEYAEQKGFHEAVKWRDSGRPIPEPRVPRRKRSSQKGG